MLNETNKNNAVEEVDTSNNIGEDASASIAPAGLKKEIKYQKKLFKSFQRSLSSDHHSHKLLIALSLDSPTELHPLTL